MAEDKGDTLNGCNLLRLELGIATGDDNSRARMLAHEFMNGLTAFMIGHLCDTTCVDDTDVRHLTLLHFTHADICQLALDRRSLGKVQLAAQGEIGCSLAL